MKKILGIGMLTATLLMGGVMTMPAAEAYGGGYCQGQRNCDENGYCWTDRDNSGCGGYGCYGGRGFGRW